MKVDTLHQFSPAVSVGDGVTNSLFITQNILLELGFKSDIYSNHIDEELEDKILHIDSYNPSKDQILLYHHSIGHIHHDLIMEFADKKILVYHNITPSHFFKNNEHLQQACDLGREQLKSAKDSFIGSYADSEYNTLELKSYAYNSSQVIPLLIDTHRHKRIISNELIIKKYASSYNILFVGRVVSNKCQHQLVDVLYYLEQQSIDNVKLFLVGGVSEPSYNDFLHNYIKNLGLQDKVVITGKVNDADLSAYYENADLYLSLSEHEGFAIPLVEAMRYDIPVLSYDSGGISTTLGEKGLLSFKAANRVAKKVTDIMDNPYKRVEILKYQREHLKNFSYENLKDKFASYLSSLGIEVLSTRQDRTNTENHADNKINYQIEGPFDTSYSLAIVNNNLAKSFYESGDNVRLYSTEGYGNFTPSQEFLKNNPLSNEIYTNELKQVDVTIRNLYPPRTNAMKGCHKVLGPYGWEESAFPREYVEQFNARLSLVSCMSKYVKDVMLRNGVLVPTSVTGIGVDHILQHKAEKIAYDLPSDFKLLHISSCFPRKGVDILLKAFEALIDKDIKISLIIKTFANPHNKIDSMLGELSQKTRDKILLINEDIDISQINYLYENCDCLVAPSRGEGFGLPMAEAMLFDLPVITTGYGGQLDFCNIENSWLIDYSFAKAKTHLNLFNSYWAEPSVKSLQENILNVYNADVDEIKLKTQKAKKNIVDNYTWNNVTQRLKKALTKQQLPKRVDVAWVSSYNTKCGIASYSKTLLEHIQNSFDSISIFADIVQDNQLLDLRFEKNVTRSWSSRFDKDSSNLIKLLKDSPFTDIVIQFNFAFFSMQNLKDIILANKDKRVIIEFHSVQDVSIKGLEASLGSIKEVLKDITQIIVHNIDDLNLLKGFGIVQNVTLLPLGVSVVNSRHQKKDNKTTIASYGFLLPHKGVLELIEAFGTLHKTLPNTHLLLLNALYPAQISQDYLLKCQNKIDSLNLNGHVTLISDYLPIKESRNLLSSADLLVLAYKKTQESASAAIREMLAINRPVLCTKQNIFNDVSDIVHFVDGYTPSEISESIIELLSDTSRLNSKAKLQEEWIKECSWKNVGKKFTNIIKLG